MALIELKTGLHGWKNTFVFRPGCIVSCYAVQ
jgi:hypothetical protein